MSKDLGSDSKALQIAAWGINLLSCLYFVWTYVQVGRNTKVFGNMFASMGVELPAPTAFLLNHHSLLYPVLFGGAAALVVAKELFLRDKKASIAVTFAVAVCVLNAVGWINQALYAPLFSLIEKLAK
jgi:hypothetical protein